MEQALKTRLRKTMIIFYSLLVYIIAALIWWFISLEMQIKELHESQIKHIEASYPSLADPAAQQALFKVNDKYRRDRIKYIGEGTVFLGLALLGGFFIYRSVKQQLKMQQQQQNFMMAVTHELKTPIAIARLNLETMLKHHLDEEKQKTMMRKTLDETARLNFLTSNILLSSQLEGRGYKFNKEDIDLSSLLKDRVREFKSRFPDYLFEEDLPSESDIYGDALLLQILFNNLIENAVKYSPKGSTITVKLEADKQKTTVAVIDEGDGIPDNEKKKIFQKFYRIGNEATRKKQGTGLGLYLCRKITDDHNADISVTNHFPKGSIFAVTF